MNMMLFYLLFSTSIWARPVVLLGHFDAFGIAPFNNSENVAKALSDRMKNHPEVDLRLCSLQTVFDKSFFQLEDCVKELEVTPALILGLGESNCNFKIETMGRNADKTKGPDNEGNERNHSLIIPDGPKELGLRYPLQDMYCSLSQKDRSEIEVSNNAGSFVCNNLAYQFALNYQDSIFGFIHVPAGNCRNIDQKTVQSVRNLESMIVAAVKSKNVDRLPTKRKELEILREATKGDKCLNEFYKRAKGADEKGLWSFLETR